MNKIYILNGQTETILSVLNQSKGSTPFWDAVHSEQLNGINRFEFRMPANTSDAQNVVEGNLAGFFDLDEEFQLFEIREVEDEHGDELIKFVVCEHYSFELMDEFVQFKLLNDTATNILSKILTQTYASSESIGYILTRWTVGTVEPAGTKLIRFEINTVYQGIAKILEAFDAEVKFRITFSGGAITARQVDILTQRGSNIGKRFVFGKDIVGVKKIIDATNVKTAIFGFGKAIEVAGGISRVKFTSLSQVSPRNKPVGQTFVEDATAKANFGRAGGTRNRFGFKEFPDIIDPTTLLAETNKLLDAVKDPYTTYEMDVVDLERLSGLSHEKVRLGDTVTVIDREFRPALQVNTRIVEIRRNLLEPEKTIIILSNLARIVTDISGTVNDVMERVNGRQGIWQENPYTQNLIKDHSFENVLVDTEVDSTNDVWLLDETHPDLGKRFWWDWLAPRSNARVLSQRDIEVSQAIGKLKPLFDFQAAVISGTSRPFQFVRLNQNNTFYTASAYFSAFGLTSLNGTARLQVWQVNSSFARIGASPIATADVELQSSVTFDWKRAVTSPIDANLLDGAAAFFELTFVPVTVGLIFLCDGAQFVASDKPNPYIPENDVWYHMHSLPGVKLNHPNIIQTALRAFATVAQTFTGGSAFAKVNFANDDYDENNEWSTINHQFVPKQDGVYLIQAGIFWDTQANGNRTQLLINKNTVDSTRIWDNAIGAAVRGMSVGSAFMKLIAGDVIQIHAAVSTTVDTFPGQDFVWVAINRTP